MGNRIILFACLFIIGFLTYFHFQRSQNFVNLKISPLNSEPIQSAYRANGMSKGIHLWIREFEEGFLRGDYKESFQIAQKIKSYYGPACFNCSMMLLDSAIFLKKKDDLGLQKLCETEVPLSHHLPRLVALCSYFSPQYTEILTSLGIDSEAWRYAMSLHTLE